ncbi:MAG: hypothetical protein ACK5LX_14410 [Oscillospiraceae bacterium]
MDNMQNQKGREPTAQNSFQASVEAPSADRDFAYDKELAIPMPRKRVLTGRNRKLTTIWRKPCEDKPKE